MNDPTTDNDALGYILHQASLSHPNGREQALIEKCGEYLRHIMDSHALMVAVLLRFRDDEEVEEHVLSPAGVIEQDADEILVEHDETMSPDVKPGQNFKVTLK